VRQRLPLALSAIALAVALLGATPLGHAAGDAIRGAVPLALFANNSAKLNGHTASTVPLAGQIPIVDATGNLSAAILRHAPFDPTRLTVANGTAIGLPVGQTVTMTATCPAGSVVVAGGYDVTLIDAGDPRVNGEGPDSTTQSWNVEVFNQPVLDSTGHIATHTGKGRATALCIRV
jgi:hypothetical protein